MTSCTQKKKTNESREGGKHMSVITNFISEKHNDNDISHTGAHV